MKKFLAVPALIVASLALAAAGAADPGDGTSKNGKPPAKSKSQKSKSSTSRFTFTVTTTDNGSCGNPWATDTLQRTFWVKANNDGTYTLMRRDRGTFVTLGGASPGACDTTGKHGKTVHAGVRGRVIGFLRGTITGGTFNPNATCTGTQCGLTETFITTFFGSGAKLSCFGNSADCRFVYNYVAPRNQTLLFRHWQNAGKGAGTMLREEFRGDIADA